MGGEGARGEETGSKRILFADCYHHSESSVAARSSVKDSFNYLVPGPPSSPRACYVPPTPAFFAPPARPEGSCHLEHCHSERMAVAIARA